MTSILLMIAFYRVALQDLFYITATASLMSPFLGIIPFRIYYHFHQYLYRRKNECKIGVRFTGSGAYKKIWEIIRSNVEKAKELRKDEADVLMRCVWDKIFFGKDLEQGTRERILFLFTTSHSLGATGISVLLSMAVIFAVRFVQIDLPYQPRPISHPLITLLLIGFVLFLPLLFVSWYDMRKLAINEELYAVILMKEEIKNETRIINEFTEALLEKRETKKRRCN